MLFRERGQETHVSLSELCLRTRSFSYSFLLIYADELGFRTGFLRVLYLIFTGMASLTSLPFGRFGVWCMDTVLSGHVLDHRSPWKHKLPQKQ